MIFNSITKFIANNRKKNVEVATRYIQKLESTSETDKTMFSFINCVHRKIGKYKLEEDHVN